jgi:hypothetical protein
MGIIEISLLVGAAWCVVLAFGVALFSAGAKADRREAALRGITDSVSAGAPERAAKRTRSRAMPA